MRPIAGKTPDKVKARTWKEFTGYDPFEGDTFDFDGTVTRIADIYGVTPEQVMDELDIDELFPVFIDCVKHINAQVLRVFKDTPKKKEATT